MPQNYLTNLERPEVDFILKACSHAACSMRGMSSETIRIKNNLEAKLLLMLEGSELQ